MNTLFLAPGCSGYKMIEIYSSISDKVVILGEKKYYDKFQMILKQCSSLDNVKVYYTTFLLYPFVAARLVRNENIDLVFTQDPRTGFIARYFIKKTVIFQMCQDFIRYLQLYDYNLIKKEIILFLNKFMLKRCCRTLPVVVLSSYLKKRARFYGARDVKVIPIHGIDTKKFYPRRSDMKKRLGINGKMLLTVGRLTPEKGTIHLIEAMESLIKDFPSLKLVVVGKGYLLDRLEKRVRELNLEENIYFEGFIDHFKLPDYYNAADLFVLPSLEEGLGYVSGEAMACEVPVVATDIGGIPDVIIHGKTGLLVPPRDSVALSNAIRNILNNKGLGRRLAKQGRKYILRNFEETVVTKAFNGYINNLLYK